MKSSTTVIGLLVTSIIVVFLGFAAFVVRNLVVYITMPDATLVAEQSGAADPIPQTEQTSAATPVAATPVAITAVAGLKVFNKCKACHSTQQGGAHKIGPNLWGIVDGPIASGEGFDYSDPMLGFADQFWDVALLDEYLTKPKALIKGTKMTFAGLKNEVDRQNLIAYLAQQSDNPLSVADLGFTVATATAASAVSVDEEENTFLAGFSNPPARSAAEQAESDARVAALIAEIEGLDYDRARYHPLHFPPQISSASNAECLTCHAEIMSHEPKSASSAGVAASDTMAWYQTLATYDGAQADFHFRHLQSDYATSVMNLECTFCHKGNDPREESPDMMPLRAAFSAAATPEFTLRKMVNPSTTCLLCHGAMPDPEEIMGLSGPWHEARADFEDEETLNGCLTCHGEYGFRTNRHNVSYLNAANIEDLATVSSDTCYGCHGGRAWYRISYPYPRHVWPDMDDETPDWALERPTQSDPQYQLAPAASE